MLAIEVPFSKMTLAHVTSSYLYLAQALAETTGQSHSEGY